MKSWFYSWIRVQAAVFYRLNPELAYFTFKIDLTCSISCIDENVKLFL